MTQSPTFKTFLKTSAAVAFLGLATSGCATAALYENTVSPHMATTHKVGGKRGEACSQAYLGLIAMGDGGIAAAAKKGGIRDVSTVDHRYTNILGLYKERCAIVTGD